MSSLVNSPARLLRVYFLFLFTLLASCAAPASAPASAEETRMDTPLVLPNLGPAPELQNEVWLNTDGPLRLAGLRGKVVLLEMWTFG